MYFLGTPAHLHNEMFNQECSGNSLMVQLLGLHALTAEGLGSISGQGTKIPQATRYGQKEKKIFAGLCLMANN